MTANRVELDSDQLEKNAEWIRNDIETYTREVLAADEVTAKESGELAARIYKKYRSR